MVKYCFLGKGQHKEAMPMYAVATIPLIRKLPNLVTQVWYADDASALGSIVGI